jgi:outer membrane protein TolC
MTTTFDETRRIEMYLMQEDLARAHLRAQLKTAEQYRRHRLATQVERAQRQAERARRRADRAAAKARLAVARLV